MDLKSMKDLTFSLIKDTQILDAHFIRWINMAYREFSRKYIITALNNGDAVELTAITGSTQQFYLPYDFSAIISVVDSNERAMDPIPTLDVAQFGEYNSFGSFACFYEYSSTAVTPLASSGSTPVLIGIPNRSTTVTATGGTPFLSTMEGEFLLPLNRNTTSGAGTTDDYSYRIDTFTSTTVVELERPFRGVVTDAGVVGDLTTGYFEVRPRNTKLINIWGDPGSDIDISLKYQRIPSRLTNDEDIPEEPRLSEALVFKAIELAGWAYQDDYHAKKSPEAIKEALSDFRTVSERDKLLVRNFLTSNPNYRSYSQIGGMRAGMDYKNSGRGGYPIRY